MTLSQLVSQVPTALAKLDRYDLIILDELGFAPLDDTGAQLLFRLVAGGYGRIFHK